MTTTQRATGYTPPAKVDKTGVDCDADNPTAFLERLRSDGDLIQKGFLADVDVKDPLPFDTPKPTGHTRFVCISDTHGEHDSLNLPDGDVLLHCGNFTNNGTLEDSFNDWLRRQSAFQHKIVIAGGSDLTSGLLIETGVGRAEVEHPRNGMRRLVQLPMTHTAAERVSNCTYLEDSEVTINGIRIWGSPWQHESMNSIFYSPRDRILTEWNKIPSDGIDILMTRGPPAGHGDRRSGRNVGCVDLLNYVQLRIQPKYHVFGLNHEASGITTDHLTTYINCSVVDDDYNLVKPPVIFDFPNGP